ncbi:MAG: ABC transporter substrate-binding protein [Oscillospiraceae bacterium]|nr:ABC transporter substrate-binding protein [Oscillospiraceae bacterium]
MKIWKRLVIVLMVAALLAVVASCGGDKKEDSSAENSNATEQGTTSGQNAQTEQQNQDEQQNTVDLPPPPDSGEQSASADNQASADDGSASNGAEAANQPPAAAINVDRGGNPISLPANIDRIISMGPSNTEVIVALGFADKIIATDTYSENVPGIKEGISMFSMMAPDAEQIISMAPDVIFVTGMSLSGGDDPFQIIADTGICIVYIPSSTSIEAIKDDIRFFASVLGAVESGEKIIGDMQKEIDEIVTATKAVGVSKKVYFEISAAPYMYSFGHSTFLNEMIELLGAENIFASQESWISVADEAILAADPDVILTSVNYIDDPIGEILSRDGWSSITAIKDNAVYYISTDASNRPSQNIVIALRQMAEAIYPGIF